MNLSGSFVDENPQYKKFESARRVAISEECGIEEEDFVYPVYKKTEQERIELEKLILNTFPCNTVTADKRDILIDAFESINFKKDDVLMKEGDYGDALFIIAEGEVSVFKNIDGENKLVNKMFKDSIVGELALLYSSPRLATVIASENTRCWKLERPVFRKLVRESVVEKNKKYMEYLNKIELLQHLDISKKIQLTDVLHEVFFEPNAIIIKEGDVGDKIYMLIKGKAKALRHENGKEVLLKVYNDYAYFGELALLNNEKRKATVIAVTKCHCLYLKINAFYRLTGPVKKILRERAKIIYSSNAEESSI